MNGNRRRKKRPSYGVRTVEITKGLTGFGFTISGQAPCILSCIVPGSPAEKAGLRPGDYLIAVNSQNVSKAPHDDVVRLIGQSKFLKLQIAENYYSDSSDDEFTINRPKPKYPNRLRHKHQQTRAEKVVRDLQSGAIFSEHAAIHNSENAPLSDRDWTDPYTTSDPFGPSSVPTTMAGIVHSTPTPSTSPTRLRPDQIRLVMAEARQVARNARPAREEAPMHPPRIRQTPKKRETGKSPITIQQLPEVQNTVQRQLQILPPKPQLPPPPQPNFQHQHMMHNMPHLHNHLTQPQMPRPPSSLLQQAKLSYQESVNHSHQAFPIRQFQHENSQIKLHHQPPLPQIAQPLRHPHQTINRPVNKPLPLKLQQSELYQSQLNEMYSSSTYPAGSNAKGITEQEINNLLYPTLAELQQSQVSPINMGEAIYRAVVGYLGTIEMPKEPQGGSRLIAIRNCIRRLRIEKKVHTLVMMSIFSEQVVLTNPHGLTLAEYPAERITFCGVYADDKKFFGLVTVHGTSSDEISEGSQDEGDLALTISSSCHVFMVDPNAVQHPEHCRRAKNFRIECTPAPALEDGVQHCLEFPESADPILHSIMSLYRNRVGFHLDTGAPGLIDVDAQMSPPHSNTSSNSSNSDSGIGFRDEGGHHYHNSERVFVVEFDDNHRNRLQNINMIRGIGGENPAQGASSTLASNINGLGAGETSDSSLPSSAVRKAPEKGSSSLNTRPASCDNSRMNSQERCVKRPFINVNVRCTESEIGNMEMNVCDMKKSKVSRNNISECNGRTSATRELRGRETPGTSYDRPPSTPGRECTSPYDGDRLTVRAMPDPISFERSPGFYPSPEFPVQISSMRHSMHKYLQHKQEHLVKVSQKINRRESDSGIPNPLSVRAFSPSTGKMTPTSSLNNRQSPSTLELSMKLSPKVFGVPFRPSAPSEHSFTRSLEDLRDSSTSDGVVGGLGMNSGSFRDGSESDHGLARLLHASETNLVLCGPKISYPQVTSGGAFRAVHPRSHRNPSMDMLPVRVMPRLGRLSDAGVMGSIGTLRGISCLGVIGPISRSMDSGDENTETTENTGGQGGSQDVHPPTQDEFSHDSDSEQTLSVVKSTERKRQFSLPHSSLAERNSKERDFRTAGGAEGFDSRFTIDEEDEASVEDDSRGTTAELPVARGGLDPRTSDINQRSLKLLLSPNTRRRLFSGHGNSVGDSNRNVNGSTKRSLCASASAQEPLEGTNQSSPSNTIFSATKSATLSLWSALVARSNFAFSRLSQNNQPSENEDAKINLPSGVDPSHTKSTGSEGVAEKVEGNEGKKQRGVSLRRLSRSRLANDRPSGTSDSNATQSDTEIGKISGPSIRVNNGGLANETPIAMSRVGSWATSFEKLIEDPAGLHTFAEFLKKEYSHENIYFWTACERYKMIEDEEERRLVAKAIFNRHLGMGASEPVNVDSQARQVAQEGLVNPDEFLFSAAQKQVFNLMKFDSYSRFLKSELYNKCLSQDRKGLPLPYPGDETLDPDLGIFSDNSFSNHLKKSKSDADERRRKSLLPWHRKDRSKSKDRGETEYWRRKKLGHRSTSESSSARSDITDSHTSLNSSDFTPGRRAISKESLTSGEAVSLSGAEGFSLCRFILPDQSNSVLAVRNGETVKDLVRQLLERRRINFTAFNVVMSKGDKLVDINKDSTVLGGFEVRVERMVLFSLYLPSRKTVYVKAKPHKQIMEILKPILTKYGLKLDLMVINKNGETKGINLKNLVTDIDGEKLIIQTKEEIKEWSDPGRQSKRNNTLDEITNRVFEDLLNGKTQTNFDDLGVLDFDSRSIKTDPTSETSSSLLGSFNRRESLSLERNATSKQSAGRGMVGKLIGNPNLVAKTKQENADLYEGLKRAQMSSLDDQRGTEINFELPDFLKSDPNPNGDILSQLELSFHSASSEGVPQVEFLSRAHPEVWGELHGSSADNTLISTPDLDLDDLEETLRPSPYSHNLESEKENRSENHVSDTSAAILYRGGNMDCLGAPLKEALNRLSTSSPFLTPPPPLPPKPKLGGPLRGPPPRPPSRQLTSLSHSLHLLDAPCLLSSSRQALDKFSVSFV